MHNGRRLLAREKTHPASSAAGVYESYLDTWPAPAATCISRCSTGHRNGPDAISLSLSEERDRKQGGRMGAKSQDSRCGEPAGCVPTVPSPRGGRRGEGGWTPRSTNADAAFWTQHDTTVFLECPVEKRGAQPCLARDPSQRSGRRTESRPPDRATTRIQRCHTCLWLLLGLRRGCADMWICEADRERVQTRTHLHGRRRRLPPLLEIRLRIAAVRGAVTLHTSIHPSASPSLRVHTFLLCMSPTAASTCGLGIHLLHCEPGSALGCLGSWAAARRRPLLP